MRPRELMTPFWPFNINLSQKSRKPGKICKTISILCKNQPTNDLKRRTKK